MIRVHRERFNRAFTPERYQAYVDALERRTGGLIEFHLSETPCFFARDLMDRLVAAAEDLVRQLLDNATYRAAADAVVPERYRVAGGEPLPTCVAVDFGLLETPIGIEGRLVELQAFPSLYGFQPEMAATCMEAYALDNRLTPFLAGRDDAAYTALMHEALVGPHDPREVVLMDLAPAHQKTRPDFVATERRWGIRAIDPAEVVRDGRRLFYRREGALTRIARVYNRIIPDELEHKGVTLPFDYRDDLDLEWIGGPDWFFRISKFSIPWLKHPWVPETHYLSDAAERPADRDEWLLKPLFSFAGSGIVFAPTDEQMAAIPAAARRQYILQRRVHFTPVIDTPHGATQAEIRLMFVRCHDAYQPVLPLVRMGRGRMMGVDYNKGLAWVGAAAGLIDDRPAV